ncbi:nucleotidyltransferase family protein [Kitasatospora kifunensis]|uniref:Mannose-1-phosphate guanylyltransferase/phosphomannomutase n=1 Tax=Kitasatospora kifunensis TaxID=58351 RepID=A0A7W7VT54_KITKI|nr:nucleotidyltransferase family protein [Kitasatospora kifunensis]MBB4921090.1 mannose-1-phosphate guanylyltransferase/phosphomannomutase [Kitasatospora kifunensis]
MKAVVMAGGAGNRLRPITEHLPKPLVRVDDAPVMAHVLGLLRRHGIDEAVVTVRYLAEQISAYFGDGSALGVRLHYVGERAEPLGTAGAVKAAAGLLDEEEDFLVVSADALTSIDLTDLVAFHGKSNALVTLCLTEVADPRGFGIAEVGADGRIRRFVEKPAPGQVFTHTANTGIYVMAPQVLSWIDPGQRCDWAMDVFPRLLADDQPVYGHLSEGYWRDIGTHDSLAAARHDATTGAYRRP